MESIGEELISEELTNKLTTLLVKRSKGRLRKNLNITIFLQDDNA